MSKKNTFNLPPGIIEREDGSVLLKNVRLSYTYVFEAKEDDNGKKSYRTTILLPKDTHKQVAQKLQAIINRIAKEELKSPNGLDSSRVFLRNGDKQDSENHHGCWTVSARETRRPTIVDGKRNPVTEEDDLIYSGVWANVLIRPWGQAHKEHGKRVNCGLTMIQFVRADERFDGGSRPDVEDVFDEVDEEFDEDGDDDGLGDI